MTVKSDLIAARDLIADQEYWTSGDHAITDAGDYVPIWDSQAYAFCADGALGVICGVVEKPNGDLIDAGTWRENERYRKASEALNAAAGDLYDDTIVAVNDGEAEAVFRGLPPAAEESFYLRAQHEAVLKCFDRAIWRRAVVEEIDG